MKLKIGPAGIGKVKEIEKTFSEYQKLGMAAAEIPFTYSVYIKTEEEAKKVKDAAEKYDISLSIHAPYFVNLNSEDLEKRENSKKRIISCLKVGTWLGVKTVVFHPGYYTKLNKKEVEEKGELFNKEKTYNTVRDSILDLQRIRKENKYTPELAPETMGKINVFGSIEDISRLVRDTQCSFCIDFAHILARDKDYRFGDVKGLFKDSPNWHIHFSGIEYSEKGERKHLETPREEIKTLLENLPKDKRHTLINESPSPFSDAVKTVQTFREIDQT